MKFAVGTLLFIFLSVGQNCAASSALATQASQCANLLSEISKQAPSAGDTGFQNQNKSNSIKTKEAEIHGLAKEFAARLGPYQDPFALAFTAEQGERIFQRLAVRQRGDKWTSAPLSIINYNLKADFAQGRGLNEKLVQWIIDDAKWLLQQPNQDRADLQSELLALKYSLEYLRRYKETDQVVDRDGKPEEKKPDEQKAEQKQQSPGYPELPKEYKPSTKDTEDQSSGKQKKHRVAEVNFRVPFFAQRYFSEIIRGSKAPFQETALPAVQIPPSRHQETGRELVVRTFGKRRVDLFLPPLFKPLQPSDPRAQILRSDTGGYVLELKGDLSEIRIPLTDDVGLTMMPPLREVYTRPVGFKVSEWPDKVQADILRKFSAQDGKDKPLQVAQSIADHIATEYVYSVGPKKEIDPIDALKQGSFQCDMAAYAMVGLLRDVYQIPSRVVGGFRAKKHQNGSDGKSYLVVPGEAHAWVEVFHDGRWHLFDPTPVKKDKKKDEQGGDNEYSDHPLENTPKPEPGEKQNQESQQSQSQADHKKRLDEDTQRRTGDQRNNEKGGKGQTKEEQKQAKDDQKNIEEITKEELAQQLELGSLELEPQLDKNALLERAMRVLLQIAVEPTQRGSDVQNRLSQISNLMRRFDSVELKKLYQDALSAHDKDHPDLKNWVDQLIRLAPGQDVNLTYQEFHRIRKAVDVYAKVLDRNGKIPLPEKLLSVLEEVQRRLNELAHPDSKDIALVQDLVKNLPSVARLLLKSKYDLTQVGPNNQTREVARQLKAGTLNDMRLLSILSPLSDFILNSTPRPETIEVRTWQRDSARLRGRDLLPLQRFSDLPRALLGQPGKGIEENLRQGTAYLQARRQRVQIPQGYGKEESERITIVLYDTSGSMGGDPGRFQAGLIGAFTAKALSDISPSGKHRHRVVIVPFDTSPGSPVKVANTQEALDVIRDFQSKLKNTGGGTDIQKALLQAMSLIADAEKRSGEPLAAANIILMTDGQAQINSPELLQARKAIDRQTPLQTMFIAINQTNEELMRFAMDSQSMGAERGFYREFTPDHMKDILKEADHLDPAKIKNAFYTEKSAQAIPADVYNLMDQALALSAEFTDHIFYGAKYVPAREHLEDLGKLKWHDIKQMDRPLEKWLLKVRNFVMHPVFKDPRVLERVVDDLVTNIELLTGTKTSQLSDHEQEQLRHLVRFAAGLGDGQ